MLLRRLFIVICYIFGVSSQLYQHQIYSDCSEPFKFSPIHPHNSTKAKFISSALIDLPESDNLFDQMVHNPCMEIEYEGISLHHSKRFLIYGTCNLERMYRLVLEQSTSQKCWHMQLSVWNPAENSSKPCRHVSLSKEYTVHWSKLMDTEIQLGATNESLRENYKRRTIYLRMKGTFSEWILIPHYLSLKHFKMVVINRTECSCCRGDLLDQSSEMFYGNTWNAHCGQRQQKMAEHLFYAEIVARLYMGIMLIITLIVIVVIVYWLK